MVDVKTVEVPQVPQFLIANVMRLDGKTAKKQTNKNHFIQIYSVTEFEWERPSGYNEKKFMGVSGLKVKDRSKQRTAPVWAHGGALEPLKGFTQ